MAEALCKHRFAELGRDVRISSAGIGALVGHPPPEEVIELMNARHGIDVSGHRARQITPDMARSHDLVLVMEHEQQRSIETWWPVLRGRVRRLGEWRDEDVVDPFRRPIKVYEKSLDQIESGVGDWTEKLFK